MYVGYTEHSTVIIWFWDILRNFDQASRANFLHLISGNDFSIKMQINSNQLP